jgi:hypothetical protein
MIVHKGFGHEDVGNQNVDWLTPPWIFKELDLTFDLDPCSPVGGIPWLPAINHYSEEDDGLAQTWQGMVWCNPPYGKHTASWLKRMHVHRCGIALVFARTDTKWFHDYCINADAILFLKKRISFVDAKKITRNGGAGAGSILVAWGEDCVDGLRRMRKHGALWEPDAL